MVPEEELHWFMAQVRSDPSSRFDAIRDMDLSEIRAMATDKPSLVYLPFPHQDAFHRSGARGRIMHGANQIGKTRASVNEDIWLALGTHPYRPGKPSNGFLVYASHDHFRQVILPEFEQWAPPNSFKHRQNERELVWRRHGRVVSRTYLKAWKDDKQAKEKFEGAAVGWAHFDEEPPWKVVQAVQIRLLSKSGHWHSAMTPINGVTPLKRLIDRADGKRVFAVAAIMDDNPRMDENARYELLKDLDPNERAVREKGLWIPRQRTAFDVHLMSARMEQCPKPIDKGHFPDGERVFASSPDGSISIWEYPVPGAQYRIGADVSEGEGAAESTATVLRVDQDMPRQVAAFASPHHDEHAFARQLSRLGMWYGMAWICIETTGIGRAVLLPMADPRYQETYYPKLYRRMLTDVVNAHLSETKKLGWYTSSGTRPILLGYMRDAITHDPPIVVDPMTYEQGMTFVVTPTGRKQAAPHCLSDRLFALALAMACLHRYPGASHRGEGEYEPPMFAGRFATQQPPPSQYNEDEANPRNELDFDLELPYEKN